jgi:DNA-binding transcriptional MocR family regulator
MKITGRTASEIFENIRREAHSGRLSAGQALPPVRELAERLAINRNTVASAYKKLVAAGIAETLGRNGTVIRPPARAGEQEGMPPGSPLVDLSGGNPDPAWLPDPLQALAASDYKPTLYGEPVLDPELERLARQWLGPDCCDDYSLTLAHGAVDAIERLFAAYLVPGDKVAVEDPCFLGSLNTLRSAGLEAAPVAMDAQGMLPEALETALADGAQAVLCTPRAQNPTGCGLSERRARDLRRVLTRHPHVLVIEDDHFALLARSPYFSIVPPTTRRWCARCPRASAPTCAWPSSPATRIRPHGSVCGWRREPPGSATCCRRRCASCWVRTVPWRASARLARPTRSGERL